MVAMSFISSGQYSIFARKFGMSAVGRLKGNHYVRSGPMIATESTKRKPGSLL